MRRTDGRTDVSTMAKTREALHAVARKNTTWKIAKLQINKMKKVKEKSCTTNVLVQQICIVI